MSEGYETKWDQEAKKRRDAEREAEQQAHEATGIRKQCAIVWRDEMANLEKLAKRTKRKDKNGNVIGGVTPQEIMDGFSQLYMEVDKRTKGNALLADWRKMLLTMIEDKRAAVISARLGTGCNYIMEVPVVKAFFGPDSPSPRVAAFSSNAEFEAIDFVAAWKAMPDFKVFLLDAPRAVLAQTTDGELHIVGHVRSQEHLNYPSAQAMQKAVQAMPEGEK